MEGVNACPRPVPNPIKWKRRGDGDEGTVEYADEGPIQYDADGGEDEATGDEYVAAGDEDETTEDEVTGDEVVVTGDEDPMTDDEDPIFSNEDAEGAESRQQSEYTRMGTFWIPPPDVPDLEPR